MTTLVKYLGYNRMRKEHKEMEMELFLQSVRRERDRRRNEELRRRLLAGRERPRLRGLNVEERLAARRDAAEKAMPM